MHKKKSSLSKEDEYLNQNPLLKASDKKKIVKSPTLTNSRSPWLLSYKVFQFRNKTQFSNKNSLIHTSYENTNNDFIIMYDENNETIRSKIYKANSVAVWYSKGNKINTNIQYMFFILMDGNIRFFWLLMDMGLLGIFLRKVFWIRFLK